ncbi:hypothetical protein HOLleu_18087 [Holothuria leucospilota]|uniref:Uncharacterized protein n=1 Tax=Holothuria leucospilota TaxID=206669 RepID=A0A9Q1C351_HOLLE|nr:hypothetical protein HOLleu_18087 [Holothuria leucospilota]
MEIEIPSKWSYGDPIRSRSVRSNTFHANGIDVDSNSNYCYSYSYGISGQVSEIALLAGAFPETSNSVRTGRLTSRFDTLVTGYGPGFTAYI